MAAELVTAVEAEQDVAEAYAYYERQRIGLGEDFLTRLDACIQAVCRAPKSHGFFYRDYRRALVRKFPYGVYYTHDESENRVVVFCIFHTSRDPKKLIERLSEY
jgi:plasmid stabilization system protein ParE